MFDDCLKLFENNEIVFSIDHHLGSEEHQLNEEYFDEEIYDFSKNRVNTFPLLINNINHFQAKNIVPIISDSSEVASKWSSAIGMVFIVYLLQKTYLAATKNILFTLIFKNLMFFYQVVGLVLSPSQLVKRVSGPLLMLFSFNVATNEADHSDSNSNDKLTTENPFSCLIPNLTPIGKLAFNIYPMGILMLLCWPICIYIFRKNEKKRANFGPAITTCLLSLYASMTKFLIQLIDDYGVNGDFIESQAFAYLAIRSYLKLDISFPKTTSCNSACTGGILIKNF